MGRYQVGEAVLQLHVGMGAGKVTGIHVGGVQGRLEFFIAGHPIEQLSSCEEQALPGQVFISPELHKIVKKHAIGEYVLTNFRLDAIAHPLALPALKELPLITQLETRLKSYVPQAVLSHLDTHEYLAELRTVSVIFVNLHVTYVDDVESPKTIQLSVAAMQAILGRFEGTVRQFLVDDKGSVLIAAFGLPPLSHEDDPLRAVDAALEMQKLLVSLKITPSIGITTGRAFCGAVGSETRREYALVGDVVNLSARLMSASKNFGGILCDETTANAARSSILFKDLAPINVKGKKNPIPVFAPLSKVAAPIGPSGQPLSPLTQEPTKVIGRQKIMAIADYRLKQLKPKAQEPGHVLILEGEAGIGKSRVLQEMRALVDPECEVFVGAGDLTAGTQTYYGSWAFIFNAALDLGSITDDNLVQPHIEGILGQISKNYPLPDLVPDWLSLAPLLNSILPLGIPENKVTSSMPDQSRAEVFQLLLIRLLQTTIDPGSVIILEDAHYFDSNSWTLTLAVAQQLRGVLIVLSLRPMKPPLPFAYQQIMHCGNASNVVLTALNAQESVALAKQFLGVTKLPDALATQIVEKGQGNPFIIEELTDALKSDGIVLVQNGECKLKPGATLQLPSTVRQLITAKFDKLTSSQKSILKVASVIGKVFDVALLIQLLPGSATKSEVQADLSVLEKTSFITPENADTTSQPTGDTPNSTPRKVLTTPDSARSFDSRVSPPASPTTKRKQAKEREAHFADEPLRSPRLMESTPANTNAPLSPSRPEEKTPKPPARTSPKKGRREKDKGKEKDDKDKEQDKEKGKDKKRTCTHIIENLCRNGLTASMLNSYGKQPI
jgi:class 3 adenylate cyclase